MVGKTITPQPPLWSPTPDTLQPVLHDGFYLLEVVGVADSGRPLPWMGAPRARAGLVLDLVLGLQHPAQAQALGDLWIHDILITDAEGAGRPEFLRSEPLFLEPAGPPRPDNRGLFQLLLSLLTPGPEGSQKQNDCPPSLQH